MWKGSNFTCTGDLPLSLPLLPGSLPSLPPLYTMCPLNSPSLYYTPGNPLNFIFFLPLPLLHSSSSSRNHDCNSLYCTLMCFSQFLMKSNPCCLHLSRLFCCTLESCSPNWTSVGRKTWRISFVPVSVRRSSEINVSLKWPLGPFVL